MIKRPVGKTKKKYKKWKQTILNFCKKHLIEITITGVVIGVLAIVINIHYGKNAVTKEDTKKIQITVEETREELHSFIDGFAENTSPEEPLREEIKKADSLFHEKKYKEAYNLYNEINKKALSAGKEKLFVLSLMGKGISIAMRSMMQPLAMQANNQDCQRALEILKTTEDYKDFIDNNAKAKLYFNLGMCNEILKNSDLAIEYYNKSLEITPRRVAYPVYLGRGFAYVDKREYNRAIRDFDKAIELEPEYVDAYLFRGISYTAKRKYKRAIQDFDKAIELEPKNATFYYYRGVAYTDKGEYERAIQDYDKVTELEPGDFGTYWKKAFAYEKMGENKEAIKAYKKWIELAPSQFKKYFNPVKQKIRELEKKNNNK